MFCRKCGKKKSGEDELCKDCQRAIGKKDTTSKEQGKGTSKKVAIISVGVIGILLLIVGGFLGGQYFQKGHVEKAEQDIALQAMKEALESSDIALEELIILEADLVSYQGLIEDLTKAIENKDTSNKGKYIKEIEEYKTEFIKGSQEFVSGKLSVLKAMDIALAFGFEKKAMDQYLESIEKLVLEEKYVSAAEVASQWEAFGKRLSPTKDHQMLVSQVDTASYPVIKLYLQMKNLSTGQTIDINQFDKFLVAEELNGNLVEKDILNAIQLNEAEKLNINLTADVSGSMEYEIDNVKRVMKDFLGHMQFNAGDRASLISFDNNISVDVDFTGDQNKLINAVDRMQLGNMTALYDALYVAVSKTSMEEGAKCVIAFTDGHDNYSSRTANEVIELAKRYKIPVFIIGIGQNLDTDSLINIADTTGGYYQNVTSGGSMEEIYNRIYREQKELYLIEYETDKSSDDTTMRNTYVTYLDDDISMRNEISFTPSFLNEKPKDYEVLLNTSTLKNNEIEDEILRIRAIWDGDRKAMDAKAYKVEALPSGARAYLDGGDIRMIEVPANTGGSNYSRTYNFSNGKLIFAYIEDIDAHRLYFKNDVLFRWRYTVDAKQRQNATNHDNMGDSPAYKEWEEFALDEGYRLYGELGQ